MKIAQVAPLDEAVPPKLYGGTERVIHYLTEELVLQGHEVTLFASGDSETTALLIATVDQSLRLNPDCIEPMAYRIVQLEDVITRQKDFDLIHFHTDFYHFPVSSRFSTSWVTTLHGRLDIPDLQPVYDKFPLQPVISVSDSQRLPLPQANWVGTVLHGLPVNMHPLNKDEGSYFAFIGRISPEKRLDRAIEIAVACNYPLKIAAKIDQADQLYYDNEIAHLLDHPLIEFYGEINEEQKTDFLGNARALLFPIDWSEPFGMVMIEAMSCGTPVIAFNNGSVPEIIDEGVTGFIVESIPQAVESVGKLGELSRTNIRSVFEKRFTAARMAREYVNIYETIIRRKNELASKLLQFSGARTSS
jgi:glycosyltransferase involved in cell wall biosynthesis